MKARLASIIRPKNDFEFIESSGDGFWGCFMVSVFGVVDYGG
jgi:hypothetical protein